MIPFGQRDGGLERVSDLASVPPLSGVFGAVGPLSASEFFDFVFIDVYTELLAFCDPSDVHLPYFER